MCIYLDIHTHKCVCMSLSLYIYIYMYTHVCVYVINAYVCICNTYIYIYIHMHLHVHIYIYIYICCSLRRPARPRVPNGDVSVHTNSPSVDPEITLGELVCTDTSPFGTRGLAGLRSEQTKIICIYIYIYVYIYIYIFIHMPASGVSAEVRQRMGPLAVEAIK